MANAHHPAHHFASHRAHGHNAPEAVPPTPGAVQIELEARETGWEIAPGRTVAAYGYNGRVPGPVIEAKQGVPLEIRFTNRLSEPTLIHWHGLRVPSAMDGTDDVQPPV